MKFGIIVFPGSNCDRDMMHALRDDLNQEVVMLWHKDKDLSMFNTEDCIVLPAFAMGNRDLQYFICHLAAYEVISMFASDINILTDKLLMIVLEQHTGQQSRFT